MITNTAAGGKLVMMHHFDAGQALALIESERLTMFGGVPTIAMQILDHPDFATFDTSSVQLRLLRRRARAARTRATNPGRIPRRSTGQRLRTHRDLGRGLSQRRCRLSSRNRRAAARRCRSSKSPSSPRTSTATNRRRTCRTVPTVVGELWIKGPNVVRGYWNKPEETAKSFTKGWLRSGDIARIDEEGFVFIVDRAKDMIIRGGENVYSVIVEAAIFEHPDVADCAVVGLPHPTLGEEVAAVVVLRPGRVIEAEEIARHVGATPRALRSAHEDLLSGRSAAA